MQDHILYKNIQIDNLNIFYRESGDSSLPVLLLLHGFPSSSHMYRDLITNLSGSFHIIAPDYPGFGQSSKPSPDTFTYNFDQLSLVIEMFIDQLKLTELTIYMQDYGGPVGLRIAIRRPQLIRSLIMQNANAYADGLGIALEPLSKYIQSPDEENERIVRFFLTLEATKWQYLYGAGDTQKINPDSYTIDQYYLDQPGNDQIQLALFRDYGNNYSKYQEWQNYFRIQQPNMMVIWGKNDAMFVEAGAHAYRRDLPNSQVIFLDGGHCALEEHPKVIADFVKTFIDNQNTSSLSSNQNKTNK